MPFVWVRAGDGDDYHRFDDLNEAAEYLGQFGVQFVAHCCNFGVEATGFAGHNYISLFHGDEYAQPLDHGADLTCSQLRFLNDYLKATSHS